MHFLFQTKFISIHFLVVVEIIDFKTIPMLRCKMTEFLNKHTAETTKLSFSNGRESLENITELDEACF